MNLNKTNNILELVISNENSNTRLDKVLASLPSVLSRSRAIHLIENGLVTLRNKPVKASYKTKIGDVFRINIPIDKKESVLEPYNFKLDVLHEDEDVIVLNKPSGLVIHPAAGHYEKTLVNALLHHSKNLSMGFHEHRPGIVHRLDKETSGLLVVCKNDRAHAILAEQFKDRSIHRIYWAISFGSPKKEAGKIESVLGRHPTNRKKFASVRTGKNAITHYKKIKSSKGLTHFELKLETGRTHQIRVHLSEMGHPIIGDTLYGADKKISSIKDLDLINELRSLNRIGLHAKELGFIHPSTGESLFFTSTWPENLNSIVRLCEF